MEQDPTTIITRIRIRSHATIWHKTALKLATWIKIIFKRKSYLIINDWRDSSWSTDPSCCPGPCTGARLDKILNPSCDLRLPGLLWERSFFCNQSSFFGHVRPGNQKDGWLCYGEKGTSSFQISSQARRRKTNGNAVISLISLDVRGISQDQEMMYRHQTRTETSRDWMRW